MNGRNLYPFVSAGHALRSLLERHRNKVAAGPTPVQVYWKQIDKGDFADTWLVRADDGRLLGCIERLTQGFRFKYPGHAGQKITGDMYVDKESAQAAFLVRMKDPYHVNAPLLVIEAPEEKA